MGKELCQYTANVGTSKRLLKLIKIGELMESVVFTFLIIGLGFIYSTSVSARGCGAESASITIKSGQKYNTARQQLIKNGWQPDFNSPNSIYGNAKVLYDKGLHEVSSCSEGLVICQFRFTDKSSNTLIVETQGEVWEKNPYPSVVKFYCK